jgi:PAS domain S-box-containing protein
MPTFRGGRRTKRCITVNAFLRARRAEDEMRASEAKFKAIFDNASSGILLLDQHLTYLEVNPAMCGLLGRAREAIVGQPLSAFLPPGTSADPKEIALALEGNGSWRGVFSLCKADDTSSTRNGTSRPIHSSACVSRSSPISPNGFDSRTSATILLASERAARAQAERASYLKDEFLGTLSHERRTPLNSILLWTQMLLQRVTDTEQVMRGLTAIERNTKMQTQLISDLLDVSGIISGKLRLDVQLLDLAATVKAALEVLTPAIGAKELSLKTWFDPRVGMISGDPARLQQML